MTTALRGNRDFRLVWCGQTLSALGNGVSQLAYPLLMLALTGSAAAAGALAAVRAVPYLVLGLPAGALVDRWDRKRTMVVCDLGRAVVMASVPVALLFGRLTPQHLFAAGLAGGVLHVFFSAAESACLPNVVGAEQVTAAVSARATAQSTCGIVAGPLGGALLQLGRGIPFLLDALSFLASALCLAFVRADFGGRERAVGRSLRTEVAEGVRWLWNHAALRLIALTAAGLQVAISGVALVAIVVARDSGAAPAAIGGLFAALGVGGVVGAVLAPWLEGGLGFGGLLLSVLWFQGALWLVLAFSTGLVAVGIVLALFSVSMPCFGIAALSYQLEVTPDALRGRVGTGFSLLIWAATPVGGSAARRRHPAHHVVDLRLMGPGPVHRGDPRRSPARARISIRSGITPFRDHRECAMGRFVQPYRGSPAGGACPIMGERAHFDRAQKGTGCKMGDSATLMFRGTGSIRTTTWRATTPRSAGRTTGSSNWCGTSSAPSSPPGTRPRG